MTNTEALMKAFEVSPVMIDIYKAGVIDVCGYSKEIHLTSDAFHNLFEKYNEEPHSHGRNKLSVAYGGYTIFCLEKVKEDDDNGVGTGAA